MTKPCFPTNLKSSTHKQLLIIFGEKCIGDESLNSIDQFQYPIMCNINILFSRQINRRKYYLLPNPFTEATWLICTVFEKLHFACTCILKQILPGKVWSSVFCKYMSFTQTVEKRLGARIGCSGQDWMNKLDVVVKFYKGKIKAYTKNWNC